MMFNHQSVIVPNVSKKLLEAYKLLSNFFEKQDDLIEKTHFISRSKHPAWEYFARLERNDAVCLLCTATVRSACSTNLSRHIIKHHPSTALQMRKAWVAARSVGVSSSAPSAAIAATSAEKMESTTDPSTYNLLVNPYSTAMMGSGLGQIGLTTPWIPYPDLRSLDPTANYETDLSIGCPDLVGGTAKYDLTKFEVKYDYPEIRTTTVVEKSFDEQPRLYHKEEDTKPDLDLEKVEERCGDNAPVKRGRPTENPCWNYFLRLDDQNVRCKLCSKVVKSACATNMTKHLERHHQHDYQHLIVQIRQYRTNKGPSIQGSQELTHILPNGQFIKTDSYPDIYNPAAAEELAGYSQTYERTIQDVWNRGQWQNNWQNTQQAVEQAVTLDTRNTGVILHSSPQNWASTSATPTVSMGEKPYMKRNRKTEHPVWEYFKRTADGNAQCTICTGVVKSPCSSNFMRHLMRHHSSEYNNVYVKWIQKRGPVGMPK